MKYRAEIDGLRAWAIIPVVLFHADVPGFTGGFVGVDVFFVISGFLITTILYDAARGGTLSLVDFWERRLRRILPAQFVMLVSTAVAAYFILLPGELLDFSYSLATVAVYASNFFFWKTTGYFDGVAELKPLLHMWSLAVEEQFYLVFPLLMVIAGRLRKRWLSILFVGAGVLSLALAEWMLRRDASAAFYLLPTRAWELLAGAFVAVQVQGNRIESHRLLRELAAWTGLACIAASIVFFRRDTPFPGAYAILPVAGTALVIVCARSDTWAGRFLAARPFVVVGLISYSAYLWHQPLLAFARVQVRHPSLTTLVSLAALSFILAYATWRFVEVPLRDRRRFGRSAIFAFALVATATLLALAWAGVQSRGHLQRFAPEDRELAAIMPREAGAYVARNFDTAKQVDFDADVSSPRRVLVIGDSFAQDFVNVLHESGTAQHWQVSARYISSRCGVLLLPRAVVAVHVSRSDLPTCDGHWLDGDAQLRRRMAHADEIWYVSSWRGWQAPLLPASLAETRAVAPSAKIRVVGLKNFGDIDLRRALAVPSGARREIRAAARDGTPEFNAAMRAALPPETFVDVLTEICPGAQCRQFDDAGQLLSYDGGHLTPAGARWLGQRLIQMGVLPGAVVGEAR